MNKIIALLCISGMTSFSAPLTFAQTSSIGITEASKVINDFTNKSMNVRLHLSLHKDKDGHDSIIISEKNGKLSISSSSGVGLCHGFYQFAKAHKAGIYSWTGKRFAAPQLDKDETSTIVSPYRDHYYLNVVTYGYTMPYWNQTRWDKEINWMALHGMDMPLALVAQEAIMKRVFHKIGLTDADMNEYFVAPAHLPWMRMGNVSGTSLDGPLSSSWDKGQIALQKHILARMRALGMKPICPAFAGFVPLGIKKHYPNIKLTTTDWGDYHNYRLDPEEPLFSKLGTLFVQEWEAEFGKCDLYLSDSFNEMDVPDDHNVLSQYGKTIYNSIAAANPGATWVMQGWMLGYQRGEWGKGNLEALLKDVPDDKMMILDLASDYNKDYWHNGYDWDFYPKFYGKEWAWSVIPNMGGKTAMTGKLEYYANGRLDAMQSANRGNLTGYGFAPEGIENNEMIYELLADGGWTDKAIDVKDWLVNYAYCRYGQYNPQIEAYYAGLMASVYGTFTDHPRFSWQFRPPHKTGSVNENEAYFKGVETLLTDNTLCKQSNLFQDDLVEASMLYAGKKIETLTQKILESLNQKNYSESDRLIPLFTKLMMDLDRVLSAHPIYRLQYWEKQATNMGTTAQEKITYQRNARRIVSTWGYAKNGLNDYSARLWSGLVSDFYLQRWLLYFDNLRNNRTQSILDLEDHWVATVAPLTVQKPIKDLHAACAALVKESADAVK